MNPSIGLSKTCPFGRAKGRFWKAIPALWEVKRAGIVFCLHELFIFSLVCFLWLILLFLPKLVVAYQTEEP